MGPLEGQWQGRGRVVLGGWGGRDAPQGLHSAKGSWAHTGTPAPGRAPHTWLSRQRHDPWEVAQSGPQGAVWTEVGRVTVSDQRLVPLPGLGKGLISGLHQLRRRHPRTRGSPGCSQEALGIQAGPPVLRTGES